MTNRATYAVIRTESLGKALVAFRDCFGCDPVAVIVNAGLVKQIKAAMDGQKIPVLANGGALLGELWLQRPAVDAEAGAVAVRSLIARVSEVQRAAAPMAAERARQLALALETEPLETG